MDEELKTLIALRDYDPQKIQGLLDLFGGDSSWVKQLLVGRTKSHDDAHLMKVAYKEAAPAWSMAAAFRGDYDAT